MDAETLKRWHAAKESHSNAVVFLRSRELYFVLASDVDVVKTRLGIRCFGPTIGFPPEEAWHYMKQLARSGCTVLRAESSGIWPVSPNGRRSEPPRPRGTFLAVDVRTIFESAGLLRMRLDIERYATFIELLARSDFRGLREYGELYVFQVIGGYDVDWELTTMLPSRAMLLARAALDTNTKLPCRLVLPRAWRGRRKRKKIVPQRPSVLGQMRMDLL
jgi:hypothetical protein